MTNSDTRAFWDSEVRAHTHVTWLGEPEVRRYVNTAVSGSPDRWPLDAFQGWLGERRGAHALSIGCGNGALERDLIRRNLFDEVDAFDMSLGSLAIARREAQSNGMERRIRYFAGDFNRPQLPTKLYDAVLIHQALHHVSALEKLLSAIARTLQPMGFLYFDEYVGPSREDWNRKLLTLHENIYNQIPVAARLGEKLQLPIQPDDPSEAVRSSEIMAKVSEGFTFVERRDYGGAVLSVLYPAIEWGAAPPGTLEWLIEKDREELARGHSYYSVVLLRPRVGPGRILGTMHYLLAPKLRTVRYHLRRHLGAKDARW